MSNTIELAKSFVPKLDECYRLASLTSVLDGAPELASVTIGSVSESYTANTAAAIDATPKAQAAEYYRILCLYADVYRGCS